MGPQGTYQGLQLPSLPTVTAITRHLWSTTALTTHESSPTYSYRWTWGPLMLPKDDNGLHQGPSPPPPLPPGRPIFAPCLLVAAETPPVCAVSAWVPFTSINLFYHFKKQNNEARGEGTISKSPSDPSRKNRSDQGYLNLKPSPKKS